MARVARHDVKFLLAACSRHLKRSRNQLGLPNESSSNTSQQYGFCNTLGIFRSTPNNLWNHQCRLLATLNTPNPGGQTVAANGDDAPKSPLAIVFTDIVKSTAIWEKDSSVMAEAMTIHDDLIRHLTAVHDGYEVKQNGDGFMVAFQSAGSALKFCLDVQMQLQDQKWPQDLLEMGPAKPVVEVDREAEAEESKETIVLWKGLRLRMSVHYGDPVCKWNEVIGRMDYLGPAVNRAARFVSVCEGGQIVVSEEFLEELQHMNKDDAAGGGPLFDRAKSHPDSHEDVDLGLLRSEELQKALSNTEFEVRVLGERHFKGVPENRKLYFIVPKALQGRLDYFPKQRYVQASKGNLLENGG